MKKKRFMIFLGGAILIIAIIGLVLFFNFKAKISKEEALDIAYKYTNVNEESINHKKIKRDFDDNSYDIEMQDEFYKYELEIDANSGKILDYEQEPISNKIENNQVNTKLLTEEEAKEIALEDAEVNKEKVTYTKVKLEKEYGVLVYEIEFTSDNEEYEYKIGAHDGKIISYSKEENMITSSNTDNQKYITKEKAKDIALKHSTFSKNDVTFKKVEFDYDNGIATYEVEFICNFNEYDYEIDAINGNIIQFKIDR